MPVFYCKQPDKTCVMREGDRCLQHGGLKCDYRSHQTPEAIVRLNNLLSCAWYHELAAVKCQKDFDELGGDRSYDLANHQYVMAARHRDWSAQIRDLLANLNV